MIERYIWLSIRISARRTHNRSRILSKMRKKLKRFPVNGNQKNEEGDPQVFQIAQIVASLLCALAPLRETPPSVLVRIFHG